MVDRMTPTGQVSEFLLAGKELDLTAITGGADGNVWFTERGADKIGRVTPSGQIAEFAIPTEGAHPSGIASGADGNVWFTEQGEGISAVGRVTPSGQVTEFSLSGEDAYPGQIVTGPDGRLWFIYGVGVIGTVSPTGAIARIELPHKTRVDAIAVGPEGNVWYTAEGDGPCLGGGSCAMRIPKEPGIVGRIEPGPTAAEILDLRAFVRHRWTKVELACGGGHVGDACRGVLRLRARVGRHSGSPSSFTSPRTFLVARRHFALATDERRAIGVRLMQRALSLLVRHPRLPVSAIVTLGGGESVSRRLVLRRSTAHRRRAADDHR